MIDKEFDPILLLESIRAGIPSRMMINNLPDLRSSVTMRIDGDLDKLERGESPFGKVIWGEYGQGKTHFLKTTELRLRQMGYAVSYYTLNRDLGIGNLKQLLPVLTYHTYTGDSNIPGIMNRLASDNLPSDIYEKLRLVEQKICHPLPALFLKALLSFNNAEYMQLYYTALMGNYSDWTAAKSLYRRSFPNEMRSMPKFTVRDHGCAFFQFFPYLLQLLGFRGWIILIDEIELIGKLGKVGRLKSYINLSYLLNWNREHSLPLYTIVASAKTLQTEVFYGNRSDVDQMPLFAGERAGEQGKQAVKNFFKQAVEDEHTIALKPIAKDKYIDLFTKILAIHRQAIPWKHEPPKDIIRRALAIVYSDNQPLRTGLRMFIEVLDVFSQTGQLIDDITPISENEYNLTPNEETAIPTGGFLEKPLSEMFDER